jgi:hypothetical protein
MSRICHDFSKPAPWFAAFPALIIVAVVLAIAAVTFLLAIPSLM